MSEDFLDPCLQTLLFSGLRFSRKLCESMFAQVSETSRPDVCGVTYICLRGPQDGVMKQENHYRIPRVVLAGIGVAIGAVRFYQVRELLAVLFIFGVLFSVVGLALLILFFIHEAALKGETLLEARTAYLRAAHPVVSGHPGKNHVLRSPRWN